MISLACADIPLKTYLNVFDCLRTSRIGRGKYVDRFEKLASEYFGVKHALAVSSGTLADIIMLSTLKEMHPGKTEVILPAFTFVAQANAVLWAGLKPVFVDEYHSIDELVNDNTLCYFPVHLLGLYGITNYKSDIPMIEDCCEAMGGNLEGRKFGTFGIAGAFSMYPSHTITTGEGGLIISDNDEFMAIARSIHNHGKWNTQDFDFRYVGINAKMTNLQAALGCELVKRIDKVNEARRKNVAIYNEYLGKSFFATSPHCYPIVCEDKKTRDHVLEVLSANGVEARKLMGCIPDYEPYIKRFGEQDFPFARKYANNGLFLPIHQQLTRNQIKYISNVVNFARQ